MQIDLVTVIVRECDEAIDFFTRVLGFTLTADEPSLTTDVRTKRWVVVRPADDGTGLLLAAADGAQQSAAVGNKAVGRVGFFLRVNDFDAVHARLQAAGVAIVRPPRDQPYGRVLVFEDVSGNRWDLIGPPRG